MHLLPEAIEQYIENNTTLEPDHLSALNRETWLKVLYPQMLSGQVQGRFLSMISHMVQPKAILEIGTFTGYSALCLAEGLAENGIVHTIEVNPELKPFIEKAFKSAGVEDKIQLHFGNAIEIIPQLDIVFDLVFIDADKENYSNYFDLVFPKVRKGGFILADNVLWSGKVANGETDRETQALIAYSQKVQINPAVENVLVSIRDGVMIARKIV